MSFQEMEDMFFLDHAYIYTVHHTTYIHITYMFQVPGPPPTPPAMVMVITSTPLPPVEWVGPGKRWGSSSQQQCNW